MMQAHILTVSQFTSQLKNLLEASFPEVWIEGELSNLSVPQSGHAYFTLKDEQCQVRAVLFRSGQRFLKFTLQQGMQVICRGRVSVYETRGEYQLVIEYIEPKGVGALQLAFEQLKARLEREGLFDPGRKKPLPMLPRSIGVVTSPTGAAIRDILRVIKRRHPRMHIFIYPVPVQGTDAAASMIEAIRYFNRKTSVDAIIIGRGGGSLEDLWAFNEEPLARAIYNSDIPVISAVGHETDYTISDFVSDLRAPTPSAAAEMVVQSEQRFCELIAFLQTGLMRNMSRKLEVHRSLLGQADRMLTDPRKLIEHHVQRVDDLTGRLGTGLRHHVRRERALLSALSANLDHLNPLGVLSRGYSITKKLPSGQVLKRAGDTAPGELIRSTLNHGEIVSRVESTGGEK